MQTFLNFFFYLSHIQYKETDQTNFNLKFSLHCFSLLAFVLSRLEKEDEGSGHLLVATLCLIEVSTFGLLESELLTILGDEEHLMPPEKEEKMEKG